MDSKTVGVSSGMKVADTGLPRGAVSEVASKCGRSVVYVWKIATGRKAGTPRIRRQLAKRGWRDPRAAQAEAVA